MPYLNRGPINHREEGQRASQAVAQLLVGQSHNRSSLAQHRWPSPALKKNVKAEEGEREAQCEVRKRRQADPWESRQRDGSGGIPSTLGMPVAISFLSVPRVQIRSFRHNEAEKEDAALWRVRLFFLLFSLPSQVAHLYWTRGRSRTYKGHPCCKACHVRLWMRNASSARGAFVQVTKPLKLSGVRGLVLRVLYLRCTYPISL